ncbi:MAG: hypothetical protein F6K31_41720 [Symploca sp. SIO2G7]|nr:hypothetical protein [Symploca sp. SIO2G7]
MRYRKVVQDLGFAIAFSLKYFIGCNYRDFWLLSEQWHSCAPVKYKLLLRNKATAHLLIWQLRKRIISSIQLGALQKQGIPHEKISPPSMKVGGFLFPKLATLILTSLSGKCRMTGTNKMIQLC